MINMLLRIKKKVSNLLLHVKISGLINYFWDNCRKSDTHFSWPEIASYMSVQLVKHSLYWLAFFLWLNILTHTKDKK